MVDRVRFCNLASVWERARLGNKSALLETEFSLEEATFAHKLIFPPKDETLTERTVLGKVATELNAPVEVLYELMGERASYLLASESSASKPSNWTLEEALQIRNSIIEDFQFIPLTKQMGEIEARLFWSSFMRERQPIGSLSFLCRLGKKRGIPYETIRESRNYLSPEQVIEAIYLDESQLTDPKKWYENPYVATRKRRYTAWSKYKSLGLNEFNGGLYQEIPKRGACNVEFLEKKRLILESSDGIVTDVAYIDYPNLGLQERLKKFSKEDGYELTIAWPKKIPAWEALMRVDDDIAIRFPYAGAFNPAEYGGYVLVKDFHIHNLKLDAYEQNKDGQLFLKAQALDGLVDFHDVGVMEVKDPNEQGQIFFNLKRRLDVLVNAEKGWTYLPDDVCIVMQVASPFIDRNTGMLSNPTFMGIDDSLGISDIVQYVDLWGGDDAE